MNAYKQLFIPIPASHHQTHVYRQLYLSSPGARLGISMRVTETYWDYHINLNKFSSRSVLTAVNKLRLL